MLKTQLANGVVIHQITQEERLVSNIYCERPFCSADSKRFLYARHLSGEGSAERLINCEYVLCEFGTWKEEVVGTGFFQLTISYGNDFYFERPKSNGQLEFVRLDFATGALEPILACPRHMGHPTVSADRRLLAYDYAISYNPQRFGVAVVNLQTGEENLVYEHPHLCNGHIQFHPTDNRTLLVQLNRGCEFTVDGKRLKLFGDAGATLLLLDALSGKTEYLQIGKPYTPPITGHQAWLGSTEKIITTVNPHGTYIEYTAVPGKGNVLLATRQAPCRQLGTGIFIGHIGSTPCGRYFFGDHVTGDYIVIGSPVTGQTVTVHNDPEQLGDSPFGQHSHPHAYLTPDFSWMVFNSDRTGRPQVYAALIPEELLSTLEDSADFSVAGINASAAGLPKVSRV